MNDCLVRAISKDGQVNATAVYTRAMVERARQIHHLTPVATAALGRALSACSMMGNALKGSGASVTMQIKGGGPLGTILTVSDAEGNVRGYVQNPAVDLALRGEPNRRDCGKHTRLQRQQFHDRSLLFYSSFAVSSTQSLPLPSGRSNSTSEPQ